MIDLTGNRKLIASIIMIIVAIGAVCLKGDVPPGLVSVLGLIFGGFVLGNVGEHAAGAYQAVNGGQDITPVQDKISSIEEQNRVTQDSINMVQQTLITIIKRAGLDQPTQPSP